MRVSRVLSLLALLCLGLRPPTEAARGPSPKLWLWAWERREDLRFLAREPGVGVAFLARTVSFGPRGVLVVPRREPLLLPEGMTPQAVVRLTLPEGYLARRGELVAEAELAALVTAILEPVHETPIAGLQLDFDARASEAVFSRALLRAIHAEMKSLHVQIPFGTTALAAKCLHETDDVDAQEGEVVPMLFSLGPDGAAVRLALQAHGDFPAVRCRTAIGVMAGDPVPAFARDRSRYVFSRAPWTPALLASVRNATPSPP